MTVADDVSNGHISTWVGAAFWLCCPPAGTPNNLRCFAGACFHNERAHVAGALSRRARSLCFRTIRGRAACLLKLSMATMAASQMEKIMMAHCVRRIMRTADAAGASSVRIMFDHGVRTLLNVHDIETRRNGDCKRGQKRDDLQSFNLS